MIHIRLCLTAIMHNDPGRKRMAGNVRYIDRKHVCAVEYFRPYIIIYQSEKKILFNLW